ncbi:MAG: TrkH family potassium uptake protein [Rhodobacteraceae bacterium]|jgi:trk system potassium uptake protein TrkH|nr:TrkH family potassium uptake protein [Paracoccaceae bacterium]
MRVRLAEVPFIIVLLGAVGLLCWLPAGHALILRDHRTAQAFLYAGLALMVLAGMLAIATADPQAGNRARSQLAALAGAYLGLPVAMALPVALAVPDTSWTNAWFEMLSCFTTTGATVYEPGRLPPSVHLWRALSGWLGGFFALLAAYAILTPLNLGGAEVLSGRVPGHDAGGAGQAGRLSGISRRLNRHAAELLPVYAAVTLLLWVLLLIVGEDGLLALSHAMGTISASGITAGIGMSVTASGLPGEILIFAFLIFALSRRTWPRLPGMPRREALHEDPELRLAAAITLVVVAVLLLRHLALEIEVRQMESMPGLFRAFWGAAFTAVSFLSTTGYESAHWTSARDWSGLGAPGLMLLGLAMVGGGVATCAGGVKLLRVHALLLLGGRELDRIVHPSSVTGGGAERRRLSRSGAYMAWVFFMFFAIAIFVVTGALTLVGIDFTRAMVFAIAALTTTGPLATVAGPEPFSYAGLGVVAKVILGMAMIVGRLEILAVIALLAPAAWRR